MCQDSLQKRGDADSGIHHSSTYCLCLITFIFSDFCGLWGKSQKAWCIQLWLKKILSTTCFLLLCELVHTFPGKTCDEQVGLCTNNTCRENGTCSQVTETTYTCLCSPAFTGKSYKSCTFNIYFYVLYLCHLNECVDYTVIANG